MFVAQTPNDYNKLNHLMNDSGTVLRPGGRVNTWFREPMAIPGPPLNREEVSYTLGRSIATDEIRSRCTHWASMAMQWSTLIVLKVSSGFCREMSSCIELLVESQSITVTSVSDNFAGNRSGWAEFPNRPCHGTCIKNGP